MAVDKWAWTRKSSMAIAPAEPRKRGANRTRKTEKALKRVIHGLLVERDGGCRVDGMAPGLCRGRLEYAHLRPRARWQTRGMDPEYRHTTEFGALLCDEHHNLYDAYQYDIRFIDEERGADGPIEVIRR